VPLGQSWLRELGLASSSTSRAVGQAGASTLARSMTWGIRSSAMTARIAADADVYAVDSPFRGIVLGMSEAQQEQGVVLLFGDGSWRYYPDGDDVSVTDGEHPVALVWEEGDVAEELTGVIGWARAQFVEEPGPNLRS
jgi:hypothetical protein